MTSRTHKGFALTGPKQWMFRQAAPVLSLMLALMFLISTQFCLAMPHVAAPAAMASVEAHVLPQHGMQHSAVIGLHADHASVQSHAAANDQAQQQSHHAPLSHKTMLQCDMMACGAIVQMAEQLQSIGPAMGFRLPPLAVALDGHALPRDLRPPISQFA